MKVDRKRGDALMILIGRGRGPKGPRSSMKGDHMEPRSGDDAGPGDDVGIEDVARDLIQGIKDEDASAVADALRAAYVACSTEDDGEVD